jgi:hypothetical protein
MGDGLVGLRNEYGAALESSFGNEADASVSIARVHPDAFGVVFTSEMIEDVGLRGNVFKEPSDQGAITIEGSIGPVDTRYEDQMFEIALAQVMGALANPDIQSDGYKQVYTVGDGQYTMTLADYNPAYAGPVCTNGVHVFTGIDTTELKITGDGAGKVVYELTVNGKTRILDSSVNTAMENFPSPLKGKLYNQDTVFRVNDNDDGALDSGDILALSTWSITITRGKKVDIFATGSNTRQDAEPDGFWEVMFEGTLTKQNDDSWDNRFQDNDHVKFDLTATGPSIGTDDYKFTILIPRAEITNYTNTVGGPENVAPVIEFRVITSNLPTGMDAITSPIQIELINTRDTNITA